jgi:hypothetical protein
LMLLKVVWKLEKILCKKTKKLLQLMLVFDKRFFKQTKNKFILIFKELRKKLWNTKNV